MNNPEYILVDEIGACVEATKTALALDTLLYQYGYITELKEVLEKYDKIQLQKFPLVWLSQPFTVARNSFDYYGKAEIELFIINQSQVNKRAPERMTDNFKAVIYPIVRELINQLAKSKAFRESTASKIEHKTTDRYYWGDTQQKIINDIFDCTHISGLKLTINNNKNCP